MSVARNITLGLAAAAIGTLGLSGASEAQDRDLTVVSWGGSYQDAQRAAYFEPFQEDTGISLLEESFNGGLSNITSQVETDSVIWDVVQLEDPELQRACQQGYLERLPWDEIGGRDAFMEGGASECGAGTIVWSVIMAYNTDRVEGSPSGWDDFFNVEEFPGTRGLRRGAKFNLEIALMADGVAPEDVYDVLRTEEGVDRAFAKLDELKPHIQWWEAGAQPPEWLAAGDVAMSTSYNGRIDSAMQEGAPIDMAWEGQVYAIDSWAIVRGSPKMDQALEFIKYVSEPENMAELQKEMTYGPTKEAAFEYVDESMTSKLPTAPDNLEVALLNNTEFWVNNQERLDRRFNSWASK